MRTGSVAIQASKATLNSGRKRRSAIPCFCGLFNVYAVNQALKVEESKFRVDRALRSARVARLRRVAAWAISMRDSVPHLAAAYPDQAAAIVTSDNSSASPIWTAREWRVAPVNAAGWCGSVVCSCSCLPASIGDSPSGIDLLQGYQTSDPTRWSSPSAHSVITPCG